MIPFLEYVKDNQSEFEKAVLQLCRFLGIEPGWLMFVIYFETSKTFSPDIVNKVSGATGLIQFMPRTARALGTTTDVLKRMSNVEQLDYVRRYLSPYAGKMKTWIDVYLAVFYPAAIGKPGYVITSDIVARQNPGFDLNKDLDITVDEIKTALRKHIPEKYKHLFI